MITKAIVEEVLSPYQVKIRVPLLDRLSTSGIGTPTKNLNIATICTLPNCYMNVQPGDIVFVGFEDNTYYKAVVLGHLCKEALTPTYSDVTFNDCTIRSKAILPVETTIGEVTSKNIACLQGASDNLQQQINLLKQQQEKIIAALFPEE